MTRDQKLALLIGFALTLAVGVLISDHLSRGSRAELAPGLARVTDPVLPSVPMPTEEETPEWARLDSEPASEPLAQRETRVPSVATRSGPVLPIGLHAVADTPGITVPGLVVPGQTFPRNETDPFRDLRTDTIVRVSEPQLLVHHVKSGESLFRIAEEYYGTGHVWRELAKFNAGRVSPDGGVRIGVALRIPSLDQLDIDERTMPAESRPAATRPTQQDPEPTTRSTSAPDRFGSYTVKAGDTFGELAQKLMGSVRHSDELLQLNKGTVSDKHLIRPGMILRYPIGPDA